MIRSVGNESRPNKLVRVQTDLVVVGGGLSGVCCALTAARQGIKVVLIQDRPVLGGNASSEVRLWALGATSHMGNNNRWAREGGVIDEIVVENIYRNPEGNALIFDTILLEKVIQESNITLLLNTALYQTRKKTATSIEGVRAFCSQNSTEYEVTAPLFCDASGDGIVGFQSGAAFRMGAESSEEFDEKFAPSRAYGELLGHSIYFMSKDVGKPVEYVPPSFALEDITAVPRYRNFSVKDQACWMWWIEYGGRLDTIHDAETIKWELWKVVYGVWNYIKNSGKFPEAKNLTLEWVGHIPGKRESRRFEGPYILNQRDIVHQHAFEDTVSFGGWAIDIHPADGIYSDLPGCNQWHSKGVYEIPYRCMFSRNIENLFFAGRIISASHLAFGSTRVMMTCAHGGQAVGMAASLCIKERCLPAELLDACRLHVLQQQLLRSGQFIPGRRLEMETGFNLKASSELILDKLPFDGEFVHLDQSLAILLPLREGQIPVFEMEIEGLESTILDLSLRRSIKPANFTPDVVVGQVQKSIKKGIQRLRVDFQSELTMDTYGFLCLYRNDKIKIRSSTVYITGITTVINKHNPAVSNYGRQDPDPKIGFESFEFWTPARRPDSVNLALSIDPPLDCFDKENILNGVFRPYIRPNAWVAALSDKQPRLRVSWEVKRRISGFNLSFDTDFDHPMETSIWGHTERRMPFVIREYEVMDERGHVIHRCADNYQTRNMVTLPVALSTSSLDFVFKKPPGMVPAALFGLDIHFVDELDMT